MSEVMETVIKPHPILIILGVSETFKTLSKAQQCFILYSKKTDLHIMEECKCTHIQDVARQSY